MWASYGGVHLKSQHWGWAEAIRSLEALSQNKTSKQKKWTGEKAQSIKVFAVQTPEFSFQNPLGGRRAMAPGNCLPASKLVL